MAAACTRLPRPLGKVTQVSNDDIAAAVLECVGGFSNVSGNSLCATRLRISLTNPEKVNQNALNSIKGVLGVVERGSNGIEVVFGPNLVRGVYHSFERLTGIFTGRAPDDEGGPVRPSSNFRVNITPEIPGMAVTPAADTSAQAKPELDVDDASMLLELLNDADDLA